MAILYNIGVALARSLFRLFARFEVKGQHLVPRKGPLLVVANHMSNGDPPAVVAAVPRRVFMLGKRGLFAGPLVTKILADVGVYPLDRDGRDAAALMWALELLERGKAVLFFPEGTRSHDGQMHKARRDGVTFAALKTGAPILPVAVTGTEKIPGLLRVAMPLCRIRVNIGEPFVLPKPQDPISRELLEQMTELIMGRVAALLPQEYRGYYSSRVKDENVPASDHSPR